MYINNIFKTLILASSLIIFGCSADKIVVDKNAQQSTNANTNRRSPGKNPSGDAPDIKIQSSGEAKKADDYYNAYQNYQSINAPVSLKELKKLKRRPAHNMQELNDAMDNNAPKRSGSHSNSTHNKVHAPHVDANSNLQEVIKYNKQQHAQQPVVHPPVKPIAHPVVEPVVDQAVKPTTHPVAKPVVHPAVKPIAHPVVEPVVHPAVKPIAHPVVEPVVDQAVKPTTHPVAKHVVHPTLKPIAHPTTKEKVIKPKVKNKQKDHVNSVISSEETKALPQISLPELKPSSVAPVAPVVPAVIKVEPAPMPTTLPNTVTTSKVTEESLQIEPKKSVVPAASVIAQPKVVEAKTAPVSPGIIAEIMEIAQEEWDKITQKKAKKSVTSVPVQPKAVEPKAESTTSSGIISDIKNLTQEELEKILQKKPKKLAPASLPKQDVSSSTSNDAKASVGLPTVPKTVLPAVANIKEPEVENKLNKINDLLIGYYFHLKNKVNTLFSVDD